MTSSKKHLYFLAMLLITFSMISFTGCKYFQSNKSVDAELKAELKSLEEGIFTSIPFPNFVLVELSNKPVLNKNLKEGKVLLVFLKAGCRACDDEVSIISNIQKRSGWDTKVWGIVQESPNGANHFRGKGIPIIMDKGGRLRKELKIIMAVPYNLLLKDGIIVKKWIGVKDEETFLSQLEDF